MRFSEKLDALSRTVAMVIEADQRELGHALATSGHRPGIAIGSGGSTAVAHFFARCRETLFGQATQVMTPAEFVLGAGELTHHDIWLFSASADNSDIMASVLAARARGASSLRIVTRNLQGSVAKLTATLPGGEVLFTPVADEKDSFLATHSAISSVLSLLLASNRISPDPIASDLGAALAGEIAAVLDRSQRARMAARFEGLRKDDLLLIVADPQLRAVADLIETSAWEASLCPVQRTDARNLAHGRHSWLHHRHDRTFLLLLTGDDTRPFWEGLAPILPASIRHAEFDFGDCGRHRNAIGMVTGLAIVEAIGQAVGIDPGKPGIADFGRALYDDQSLLNLAHNMTPAVRQKRLALLGRDDASQARGSICAAGAERLATIAAADIGGIVFDYDGTLIDDAERCGVPRPAIVEQLVRLASIGVQLAIATGRGGSAGTALRKILPASMHDHVIMGYYNGAYIQPLIIDIEDVPPAQDPALAETFAWLGERPDLFSPAFRGRFSNVQISIRLDNLADQQAFGDAVQHCPPVATGCVRHKISGHSIDFFRATTSKRAVIDRMRASLMDDRAILCIGDSGARAGNDNELLSNPYGISVGTVCGRSDGCWSVFGTRQAGPEAVLTLLEVVQRDVHGRVAMRVDELALDNIIG